MANDWGGWDPNDMHAYWEKVFAVEAAGNRSDEDLDKKLHELGLQNKAHFDRVRETFGNHYGSDPAFVQAGYDVRTRSTKQALNDRMQGELKGDLAPFEGVTLAQWAFVMAKMASQQPLEPLLAKAGWDKPKWDRVSAEWNARMSRDTTATIATAYGQAFMASGDGPFADAGKAGAAAMLDTNKAGVDGKEPCSFEKWIEITEAQSAGSKQGMDAAAILKSYGMSPADWGTVGMWWGQKFNANAATMIGEYNRLSEKYKEKFAKGFAADSIDF